MQVTSPPITKKASYSTLLAANETLVPDGMDDILVLQKLKSHGVRIPPKYEYLKNFARAKDDPDYEAAAKAGAEWRGEINRKSLEEFDAHRALDS